MMILCRILTQCSFFFGFFVSVLVSMLFSFMWDISILI